MEIGLTLISAKNKELTEIPVIKEGSKHFFAINNAENWDFESYFVATHNDINKYKQISKVKADYDTDLNWIHSLRDTPVAIKSYVLNLIKREKPNKAALKAAVSKRALKKRKVAEQTVIFNGPINGSTINNINHSEVRFQNNEIKLMLKKFQVSGKGVSPKPHLDRDLYNKHMEARNTTENTMPQIFHQYIDKFINSNDLKKAKKNIRSLSLLLLSEDDDNNCLEFLEKVLKEAYKAYSSFIDYNSNEDAFNQLFIWPYIGVIAKSTTVDGCNPDFVQGQPYLESMSRQLKSVNLYVDDKNQYKSDGLIKLFGLNNLEFVLVETSGSFSNKDKNKLKLDHHKGVYGALAMLKCIVDDYSYASLKSFSKVKVFFLHGADTELHFWSVCYQNGGIFDLWREANLEIKPEFEDKGDFLPDLVQFCWEVKSKLNESMINIIALKEEHKTIKSEYRYSSTKPDLLSSTINPIILKLTKEEDYSEMSSLGPCYSPPHP
ncbi:hypothetical protein MFLAVUS_009638 [Mucor flavus]|uniref:Uncharacterized protein n=1 Tax=Mucor flavus TaxID=439312 RepID=A0ABP9ZAG5_9FUNG